MYCAEETTAGCSFFWSSYCNGLIIEYIGLGSGLGVSESELDPDPELLHDEVDLLDLDLLRRVLAG